MNDESGASRVPPHRAALGLAALAAIAAGLDTTVAGGRRLSYRLE